MSWPQGIGPTPSTAIPTQSTRQTGPEDCLAERNTTNPNTARTTPEMSIISAPSKPSSAMSAIRPNTTTIGPATIITMPSTAPLIRLAATST